MRPRHTRHAASPARLVAQGVLVRVARDGAYADRALAVAMERAHLSPEDRRLATELVMGSLRHQHWLDFVLGRLLDRPLRKLPEAAHQALRLALYELLQLRTPDYATVSEAVALVRGAHPHLAGVANAVLRRAVTLRDASELPTPEGDPLDALAITGSHPAWLVRELAAQRGLEATRAWIDANNAAPPVSLRARRGRATPVELLQQLHDAGIDARLAPLPASWPAVWVQSGGDVRALPGFAAGAFSVQDAAAQLVGLCVDVTPGMVVLDACAAPGGKAAHLAERLGDRGVVVAVDVHPGKTRLIQQNAARLGLDRIAVVTADATDAAALCDVLAEHGGQADLVVVDAPCSGLGTLRRNPELRARTELEIDALARLQDALLDATAAVTRPGGALLYAVCTVTEAEGEARVRSFLSGHADFALAIPSAADVQPFREGPFLRTWTDRDATDSFFAAVLRRNA